MDESAPTIVKPGPDLALLEPGPGQVVAWYHMHGNRHYTYCAIRIVSDDARRWFISGGSNAIRGSAPTSPARFDQIVEHADGPIQVATAWATLGT